MLSTFGTLLPPPPLFACVTITLGAEANLLEVNVTVVPEALIDCDANVSTIVGVIVVHSEVPVPVPINVFPSAGSESVDPNLVSNAIIAPE